METLHSALGATTSLHADAKTTLMHRWRFPSLSVHGVEGAFYSPGDKTVIPAKVTGKFSIRTVPNMEPDTVTQLVTDYVNDEFKKLSSKNIMTIRCSSAGKPWHSSFNHWNFGNIYKKIWFKYRSWLIRKKIVAGRNAVEKVFKQSPDLTREGKDLLFFLYIKTDSISLLSIGGSIPVTLTFEDALKKNVILICSSF